MNSSDWLQIVLSLAGFFVGAGISWVFFRAQQTTDFNYLRDVLTKVSHDIGNRDRTVLGKITSLDKTISKYDETLQSLAMTLGGVKELADVSKRLDTMKELNSIRTTIENIDNKLGNAVASIISEVKEQQESLSETLQCKFTEQWQSALPIIETSLRKELTTYIPISKEQDILLEKMLGLLEQAISKTGEYQRINFEQSLTSALIKIETSVKGVVGNVTDEVQGLENKFDNVLLALPDPKIPFESHEANSNHSGEEQKEYIDKKSDELKKLLADGK
jgi:hypothetical protein